MLNISKELYNSVPKLKPGQRVIFELTGLRKDPSSGRVICPNKRSIHSVDRIWDEYSQEYVDMQLIESVVPNQNPNSLKKEHITLRRIAFTRRDQGQIVVSGDKKSDEELYVFLYLSNQNETNRLNNPNWIAPSGGICRYQMLEPTKTDKDKLEFKRKVRLAGSLIDDMDETRLRVVAKGLSIKGISRHSDPDSIRMRLVELSEKSNWVDRILQLDEDVSIEVIAIVKDAEEAGLIAADKARGIWVWADTKDKICGIVPGKNPEVSLKDFLISESGSDTFEMLQAQLSGSNPMVDDIITDKIEEVEEELVPETETEE